ILDKEICKGPWAKCLSPATLVPQKFQIDLRFHLQQLTQEFAKFLKRFAKSNGLLDLFGRQIK
ncbi:hypothetical protein EBQ74_09030, partial [bacterium]|nr:hypothetical protein [bacterium]